MADITLLSRKLKQIPKVSTNRESTPEKLDEIARDSILTMRQQEKTGVLRISRQDSKVLLDQFHKLMEAEGDKVFEANDSDSRIRGRSSSFPPVPLPTMSESQENVMAPAGGPDKGAKEEEEEEEWEDEKTLIKTDDLFDKESKCARIPRIKIDQLKSELKKWKEQQQQAAEPEAVLFISEDIANSNSHSNGSSSQHLHTPFTPPPSALTPADSEPSKSPADSSGYLDVSQLMSESGSTYSPQPVTPVPSSNGDGVITDEIIVKIPKSEHQEAEEVLVLPPPQSSFWQRLGRILAQLSPSDDDHTELKKFFRIHTDVEAALTANGPVVALESTIISHGMPFPQNLETALRVEETVKRAGGTPATIAILDGVIHIGLTVSQLKQLAQLGKSVRKVSRRDLAVVVAKKENGATTVAATMLIAHMAGISVFVTGGIGGVHHGVADTWDISADLNELSRTPVAVVCAGVKSILDIPKTLEFLETSGVTVATLNCSEFPAFFTRHSHVASPLTVSSPQECADLIAANTKLHLSSGMVFAVPIPESDEANATEVNNAIAQALCEAKEQQIVGKESTPFLLKRINELTEGRSLVSNIALVLNNARVGTAIAVALSQQQSSSQPSSSLSQSNNNHKSDFVVCGCTNLDINGIPDEDGKESSTGRIVQTWGGVGRNIADCLAKLEQNPLFVTFVGNDAVGKNVVRHLQSIGIQTRGIVVVENVASSSVFSLLNSGGEMQQEILDMGITDSIDSFQLLQQLPDFPQLVADAKFVVLDANWKQSLFDFICDLANKHQTKVVFDPSCAARATACVNALRKRQIAMVKPSAKELLTIASALNPSISIDNKSCKDLRSLALAGDVLLAFGVEHLFVSLSEKGVLVGSNKQFKHGISINHSHCKQVIHTEQGIYRHYPPCPLNGPIVSTVGAGDTLLGAILWSLNAVSDDVDSAVLRAQRASALTVQTNLSVSSLISPQLLLQ